MNPQMNPQINQQQYQQQYPQINKPLLNNYLDSSTFFDRIVNHLKETIFVICLFILFTCDYVRNGISTAIPSLANENKNINILGTVLFSIIYGMVYICFRQFV